MIISLSGVSDATFLERTDAGIAFKNEITTNGAPADIEAAFDRYCGEGRKELENKSSGEESEF